MDRSRHRIPSNNNWRNSTDGCCIKSTGPTTIFVPLYGSMAYPAILIEPNPKIVPWTEVGSVRPDELAIVSSGEVPVTVETILVGGEGFSIDLPTLPVTLGPGDSLPINIYFAPWKSVCTRENCGLEVRL